MLARRWENWKHPSAWARRFSANEISIFWTETTKYFNDPSAILPRDAGQSRRDGAQIPTAARLVLNHWKLLLDQNYLKRSREAVIRVIRRLEMVTLKNKLAGLFRAAFVMMTLISN